jgi:hypothetical protein
MNNFRKYVLHWSICKSFYWTWSVANWMAIDPMSLLRSYPTPTILKFMLISRIAKEFSCYSTKLSIHLKLNQFKLINFLGLLTNECSIKVNHFLQSSTHWGQLPNTVNVQNSVIECQDQKISNKYVHTTRFNKTNSSKCIKCIWHTFI